MFRSLFKVPSRTVKGAMSMSARGVVRARSALVRARLWPHTRGCAVEMMSMTMRASVSHASAVRLPRHRHTASAKARGRVAAHAAAVKPWKANDCKLVLEDGSVWPGKAFGAKGTQVGEVVFNTSLSGYVLIDGDGRMSADAPGLWV